ncbi:hypothetical protein LCGC14_2900100, partial [marine sediment metagenome]
MAVLGKVVSIRGWPDIITPKKLDRLHHLFLHDGGPHQDGLCDPVHVKKHRGRMVVEPCGIAVHVGTELVGRRFGPDDPEGIDPSIILGTEVSLWHGGAFRP